MPQRLNAADFIKDFPEDPLGAAIRACPYGGTIYAPGDETRGPWRPATAEGWNIDKPLTIYGDGRVNEWCGLGYYIDPIRGAADSTVFNIKTGGNNFHLHDIAISAPKNVPQMAGTGDGIRFVEPGAVVWGCTLERVGILYAGRHGININGLDTTSTFYFVAPHFDNVVVYGAASHGIVLRNATAVSFNHVYTTQNRGTGMIAYGIGGSLDAVTSESNGWDLKDPTSEASCLYIDGSYSLSIRGCWFEAFGNGVVNTAVILKNVIGSSIDGNLFEAPGERGLYMQGCKANFVGANTHYGLKVVLEMDDACTGNTILPQHHESWGKPGNVIVPKNKKNIFFPNTKPTENLAGGIALPEVNGTSEIANPRNGMLIYDQKAGRLKFYHNGRWRTVSVS